MSVLAETNRVLYVGPPDSLREGLAGILRGAKRRPVLEQISPSLYVYHEPRLLGRANPSRPLGRLFNWATGRLRLGQVRRFARRLGMSSPLLWVFDPMMTPAVGTFGEKLVVAHVLDNYVELIVPEDTSLRAEMARNEETLLGSAQVVFAVSPRLHAKCLQANPNSFLVPNGVDYERFQAALANSSVPPDIARLPRPIIGYVGAIQPLTIDFVLLDTLASDHPEWSLVLVGQEELGRDRFKLQALLQRTNVHYLGRKPVQDVPAYMHACDVCVIVDEVDEALVTDCDKIKLYEYLACGRPIVSTDIPFIRGFRPLVEIASGPADFARCVERCLREDPHRPQIRQTAARDHSWRRRVETMSEAIGRRLNTGGMERVRSASRN
jgi:glycosyltransferase involved in cell wall biosynthesis